ncbi:MAG: glycosyltransferase family 1 protein [Patescibacteria group bacterium]|mgnify:CR=1 FL=1
MVIGFDASRVFVGKRTGTENYSYQLLKSLSKIDKKNSYKVYIRFINDPIGELMKILPKNSEIVEIKWNRLWTQGGLAIQTFIDSLDVLFIPSHTLPIIRKPGLKTVMTVHDLGVEYLPYYHQLKQQLYLKYITRYQLQTATKLIAVSNATKEDLLKKASIHPQKVSVVYEGFDNNLFRPVKSDILVTSLRQYKLIPGEYFLSVGTVQPRKNLERLIKAFYHSQKKIASGFSNPRNDIHLVIAGSKGWLADEIYRLPKELGIEDKVKFLGYVPDKDLPALYSGAIALTFPSLFEGFGLPILEAQACGCPVVTSNISSMPEVAGKGAIYVNPYSVDDIVKGMGKCQISNVKSQIVKAGFENVKRFSWEKTAKETLKILEEAAK